MREAVEDYIAAGGSILSFSGNTCWWQTRVQGDRLICYKYDAGIDPFQNVDPDLVTTHWDEPPVNDPPTRFLGLSWREGGMVNHNTSSSCPCPWDWLLGHGGYRVDQADHWAFAGTGLEGADDFGRPYAIVGYEVDGAPVEMVEGRPRILPSGGTPQGFEVLGHAACWNRYRPDTTGVALMAIRELGSSFVFNGGTTGWCWGLPHDSDVQRVTRNLIAHLSRRPLTSSQKPYIAVYPNPASESVRFEIVGIPRPDRLQVIGLNGSSVGSLRVHRTTTWDLTGRDGGKLPSGIYWAWAPGVRPARLVCLR
jgi:hypothetical protein